ncbi:MAG: asparagine--tRNA ligase, partial [Eubacterium sp.]|nr:asparagine--tRNA ligase [Eubacterium sp.]
MKHTDIKEILFTDEFIGKEVTVCGWVRTSRDSKNVAFLELNDGSSLTHLQIVIDKAKLSDIDPEATKLGASLKVIGSVVKNERNNTNEVDAKEITVLGKCPGDYPLQKKFQKLETLREMPHIRVRTNTFNAVFRVRSIMAAAIHRFFQERGYVYINTPLITGSDAEGAGEMFQVTTVGFNQEYKTEEEYYANDFFGKKTNLSVSGQLEG